MAPELRRCVDCLKLSPLTETAYTLISGKFSWRLSRRREADGTIVSEWRCPDCWRKHKTGEAK